MKYFTNDSGLVVRVVELTKDYVGTVQLANDVQVIISHTFRPDNDEAKCLIQWTEFKQMKYSQFTFGDSLVVHQDGHMEVLTADEVTGLELTEVTDEPTVVEEVEYNELPPAEFLTPDNMMKVGTNISGKFATTQTDGTLTVAVIPAIARKAVVGPSVDGVYSAELEGNQEISFTFAIGVAAGATGDSIVGANDASNATEEDDEVVGEVDEGDDGEAPVEPEPEPADPEPGNDVSSLDDIVEKYDVRIYVMNGGQSTALRLVKNDEGTIVIQSTQDFSYVITDSYLDDNSIQNTTRVSFMQSGKLLPSYVVSDVQGMRIVARHKIFGTELECKAVVNITKV